MDHMYPTVKLFFIAILLYCGVLYMYYIRFYTIHIVGYFFIYLLLSVYSACLKPHLQQLVGAFSWRGGGVL